MSMDTSITPPTSYPPHVFLYFKESILVNTHISQTVGHPIKFNKIEDWFFLVKSNLIIMSYEMKVYSFLF